MSRCLCRWRRPAAQQPGRAGRRRHAAGPGLSAQAGRAPLWLFERRGWACVAMMTSTSSSRRSQLCRSSGWRCQPVARAAPPCSANQRSGAEARGAAAGAAGGGAGRGLRHGRRHGCGRGRGRRRGRGRGEAGSVWGVARAKPRLGACEHRSAQLCDTSRSSTAAAVLYHHTCCRT